MNGISDAPNRRMTLPLSTSTLHNSSTRFPFFSREMHCEEEKVAGSMHCILPRAPAQIFVALSSTACMFAPIMVDRFLFMWPSASCLHPIEALLTGVCMVFLESFSLQGNQ